jgi:hypothetical protein
VTEITATYCNTAILSDQHDKVSCPVWLRDYVLQAE